MCERAKNHFDPSVNYALKDDAASTSEGGGSAVVKFKDLYKPTHETMRYKMLYVPLSP